MEWDWQTILDVSCVEGHLVVALGPALWLVLGALTLTSAVWLLRRYKVRRSFTIKKVSFSALGTTVEIERNQGTVRLAHAAYVELITRKAAIGFDTQHDVIAETYDSWFEMFGEIRRLARHVEPAELESNEDLRRLHDVLIDILNEGLRPHLTMWQASFRRWYEAELAKRPGESPQTVQRDFPSYGELVIGIAEANRVLVCFAEELRQLRSSA